MQIYILKPFQNNGVWFHAGMGYEVDDLRAKDLIDAGLATDKNPLTVELKPRIGTQMKPRQPASTKKGKNLTSSALVNQGDQGGQGDQGDQGGQGDQGDQGGQSNETNDQG